MTSSGPAEPVTSPCRRICKQDRAAGFCIGCGRTPREVIMWFDMTAEARGDVEKRLPDRLRSLKSASGH